MKLAIVLHSYSSFDFGKYTGLHFLSVQVCNKLTFYVIQDSALMITRLFCVHFIILACNMEMEVAWLAQTQTALSA